MGRSGEESGWLDSTLRVERSGAVLTHQQLCLGREPRSPAVLGGHRVVRTVVEVGAPVQPNAVTQGDGWRAARCGLSADASILQIVGDDVAVVAVAEAP